MLSTLLACTTLLTATVVATPADTLAKVEAVYRAGGDIAGRFEQTFVQKLRGKKHTETGRLWAKQDGRVRWQYLKPVRKDFIYNGKTAYFYEPENAQVTVFDDFNQSQLSSALRFLMGQGEIGEAFDLAECKKKCDLGEKGDLVLALWPKKPLADVDHALLFVDPKNHRVRMSVIFDSLGNRSEYRFLEIEFNQSVADKKFIFKKPAGVQELRETLGAKKGSEG